QPRVGDFPIGWRSLEPRIGEPREIPGRIDKRVHGVGLAPPRLVATRARDVLPGRMAVERISRAVEIDVVGQPHGQVAVRYGNNATGFTVDNGDRAAPVALPRDAPIAQTIIDLAGSDRCIATRLALEPPRDLLLGSL